MRKSFRGRRTLPDCRRRLWHRQRPAPISMRQRGEADFAPSSVGRATRRETRLTSRESPPSERHRLQLICDAVRRASGSLPGGGRPSVSGICPSSRAWCRAGCVARSPAAGTRTSAPEDQIDQQHFSFRLRLCGRRAWLARQWMLPRAAPESGTRGCISALPCLASPVSQYACSASLLRLGPQPRSARSAAGRLAGEGRVLAPK